MIKLPTLDIIQSNVRQALDEDIGSGDLTASLIEPTLTAQAHVVCRDSAILCGSEWFKQCFVQIDPCIKIIWFFQDGAKLNPNDVVCKISGNARAIVSAERTALNFLQTLSGTATLTSMYVKALASSSTQILDTRKTLPGLRYAQKYAVTCGGGSNHRFGLHDAILIKENHIAAAGSIDKAMQKVRDSYASTLVIIEVENMSELAQAISASPHRILLDNFDLEQMRAAVAMCQGRCELEVSGNVSLESVADIAATGVNYISIGALTKHVTATDFSLRVSFEKPAKAVKA